MPSTWRLHCADVRIGWGRGVWHGNAESCREAYIHPADELTRFHALEIAVHAPSQPLLIPRNRPVDLTDRLAEARRTEESAGKARNVTSEPKFAVIFIGAHEVKVLFDIHAQQLQHLLRSQVGGGKRIR